MPSKKHILHRLGEIEKQIKVLRCDIEDHYKQETKDIIIESPFSDLKVEILSNGWTSIIAEDGDKRISMGKYPNKRFEILEQMFNQIKNNGKA